MRGSGMPVMKLCRQLLTRFRFARYCGLKQQFLDISRQIGPSLEYCTAKQNQIAHCGSETAEVLWERRPSAGFDPPRRGRLPQTFWNVRRYYCVGKLAADLT
jgi:hypothetical protein